MIQTQLALSPGRLDAIHKLSKKLEVPYEEVREALKLRRHIPVLAEEYLRAKKKGVEEYPLWSDYLAITDYDRVE